MESLFAKEARLLRERLTGLPPDQAAERVGRALPLINTFLARYPTAQTRNFLAVHDGPHRAGYDTASLLSWSREMRATWFHLLCCAVLTLSLPAMAEQEKKVVGEETFTRRQFEQLRGQLSLARYKQGLLSRRPSRPEQAVPWEELPLYGSLPVPGAEPQGALRAALDEARTFYMENTLAMESELSVSGSLPAPLSRRNLTVDMRVTELRDAQGRGVPFRLAPNQPGVDAYTTEDLTPTRVFRILVPAKGHTFPRQLDGWTGAGVAKLRVPVRYRVISFTAADVGKTRGDLTLKAWKHGRVRLEDARGRLARSGGLEPERLAEVVGLTAEGRRLNPVASDSEEPVRRAFAERMAKYSWEALPAVTPPPADLRRQVVWQDHGPALARLDVYVVTRVASHTLPFRIVPMPRGVDVVMDAPPVEVPPRALCDVSAASLAKDVRVFASRRKWVANADYGKPMVAAQLPVCDNTWFSSVALHDLKYLDATGQPVPAALESARSRKLAHERYGHEFFLVRPEPQRARGKDALLSELARIEGVARITLPRLRVLSLTRASPRAEGVELLPEGDSVRVRMPAALHARLARAGTWPPHLRAVTAYDAKGRLLKELASAEPVRTGEQVDEGHRYAFRWERIDVLLVEEQVQAELPFGVTPPPAPEPLPPEENPWPE